MKRLAVALLLVIALTSTASAYYHFLRYVDRDGKLVAAPEKFNLQALPNRTVYFYVSEQGPDRLYDGDSFPALISQLQLVARAWSGIETSDLRVAFGGFFKPEALPAGPSIEVTFQAELPPGVIAQGGPISRGEIAESPTGPFVPIQRSVVYLNKDLYNYPSYTSAFFTLALHEMGHALGLQHTLASSAMSTSVTRSVGRAMPIAPDDIAAVSLLYPGPALAGRFGRLSGRVTMDGAGVHLASVVALTPTGSAVSTLTRPDGTYTIDGLGPADYLVYVHPLPPGVQSDLGPAEIVLPTAPNGERIPASQPFKTVFHPGTRDWAQATPVRVAAGEETAGIEFAVERKERVDLYSIESWTPLGSAWLPRAPLNIGNPVRPYLALYGPGLMTGGRPADGMSVSVIGGSITVPDGGVYPLPVDPNWLQVNLSFSPMTGTGPRHLVFNAYDDVYVLPNGLNLAANEPPAITAIERRIDNGRLVADVTGTSFTANTRIQFDGAFAETLSFLEAESKLTVAVPPAAPGHRARVIAMNPDGQISSFAQTPVVFDYDNGDPGAIAVADPVLPAGAETMIEIAGTNTRFGEGEVKVVFGTGDVVARKVWVVAPNLLRVNVLAAPGANFAGKLMTVITALQSISLRDAVRVEVPSTDRPSLTSDLTNAGDPLLGPHAGSLARIRIRNASLLTADAELKVGDARVKFNSVDADGATFVLPEVPAGPAIVRLMSGDAELSRPVFVRIDPVPPAIKAVEQTTGPVTVAAAAVRGELLTLTVTGLGADGQTVAASRMRVDIGGVAHTPAGDVLPVEGSADHRLLVQLSTSVEPGDAVPVVLFIDGKRSKTATIAVRP